MKYNDKSREVAGDTLPAETVRDGKGHGPDLRNRVLLSLSDRCSVGKPGALFTAIPVAPVQGRRIGHPADFAVLRALPQPRQRRCQPLGFRGVVVVVGAGLLHRFGLGLLDEVRIAEPLG